MSLFIVDTDKGAKTVTAEDWRDAEDQVRRRYEEAGKPVRIYDASTVTDPLHGVAWPMASNGDYSLPWVETDMDHDRFATDIEAAQYVADLIGSRVMWAPLSSDPQDGSALQVFVLPDTSLYIPFAKWPELCDEAIRKTTTEKGA